MRHHTFQIQIRVPRARRRVCCGRWLCLVCGIPLLVGCGGGIHSMWNTHAQGQVTLLSPTKKPCYEGKVFLTECGLPASEPAEQIGKVDVSTVTDQPTDTVLIMLSDQARAAGANAVIDLKIWRQGSGFSWKAPQGSGLAVRVADTNSLAGLNGYWR